VTDRGLPLADGAPACPFVAFEDDRDERASVPDHRHRCYAEPKPAPRALAHQEAYCLSSAFPVCPTFQDWARREAARASGSHPEHSAATAGAASAAMTSAAVAASAQQPREEDAVDDQARDPADDEAPAAAGPPEAPADVVRRNPPRDWSAPPPWLASTQSTSGDDAVDPPPFLGKRTPEPGQGLAGSPADQLAGGPPPSRREATGQEAWAAAAGAAAVSGAHAPGAAGEAPDLADEPPAARPARRPRAYDQHLGGPDGPEWERPRRSEAYPTIRTRVGVPQVPRIALMAVAIVIAALALFFIVPGMLNIGGPSSAGATPSPSAASSASLAPTQPPAPTPLVYVIKKGDTLSKVAKDHGLTLEELLAANPQIKNANKVAEGQQIVIPVPGQEPPAQGGGSASPSAAP
jgi:LysM repeat protein